MTGTLFLLALACDHPAAEVDSDGDQATADIDCDDNNPEVHPWAEEECDGIDNDCDGEVDEDFERYFYLDGDGDGYGDPERSERACEASEGYVKDGEDCDDGDPLVNTGMYEVCDNSVDEDCDGSTEEPDTCLQGVIYGSEARSRIGAALALGDLNLDGVDDVLVGASSPVGSGESATVWLSPTVGEQVSTAADAAIESTATSTWDNAPLEHVAVLSGTGAVGQPRLAVGVPMGVTEEGAGAVYFFDMPVVGKVEAETDSTASWLGSYPEDGLGASVADAGDVDGDGFGDLVAGAARFGSMEDFGGAAYVFSGSVSGAHSVEDALSSVFGVNEGDNAGYSVAGAGDLNGDGFGDIAIGVPQGNVFVTKGGYAGRGYVAIFEAPLVESSLTQDADIMVVNPTTHEFASEVFAGDWNGDGYPDLVIGSHSWLVLLLEGPLSSVQDASETATATFKGAGEDLNHIGFAGDLNGDESPDLLVADRFATYALLGPLSGYLKVADAADWSVAHGVDSLAAGDVDGDGLDEVIVGGAGWPTTGELESRGRVGIVSPW